MHLPGKNVQVLKHEFNFFVLKTFFSTFYDLLLKRDMYISVLASKLSTDHGSK